MAMPTMTRPWSPSGTYRGQGLEGEGWQHLRDIVCGSNNLRWNSGQGICLAFNARCHGCRFLPGQLKRHVLCKFISLPGLLQDEYRVGHCMYLLSLAADLQRLSPIIQLQYVACIRLRIFYCTPLLFIPVLPVPQRKHVLSSA